MRPSHLCCGSAAETQSDDTTPPGSTLGLEALGPRLAPIRALTERHLVRYELSGRTLRLTYRQPACAELGRIVEGEKSCCAFLTFHLAIYTQGCELTISSPEGTEEAMRWLARQIAPAIRGRIV